MEDQERKAEPFDSPGTKNSNKKNVRFKRSKIFVTPSNDSAEDSDPPVNSISRLASYANRRSPRTNHTSVQGHSSQMFVPMSPTQATISSASCSPSSISDSHHLTESSPLMETPEAIRNWNIQKSRRTADTTYLSSSCSPGSLASSGQGGYNYYYSDLRAEMNAMTPGKSNWKSMLMHNGDDEDYDHRTRFERFMGDGRRMRCYAFIALLGSLLFTLIWLVTIEPCSTSDSIHSSIKYVFGKTGSHSNSQQIQSLAHWEGTNMVNWEGADIMSPVRRLLVGQGKGSRFGRRGSSNEWKSRRRRTMEKSGKVFRNSDKDDGGEHNDEEKDEEVIEDDEEEDEELGKSSTDGKADDDHDNTDSASATLSSTFRLVLLGDSLMSESYKKTNLGGVIEDLLSSETVSVINCAKSGSEIRVIRERPLLNCTLPHNPDATILFFDTDISMVDESELSAAEVMDVRDQYRADTSFVVETLLNAGSQVALCSPGVLGEGARLFGPIHSPRLYKKQKMLNDYTSMNQEIAAEYDIPFIDVRQAFTDAIPFHQLYYRGCVTYDGEHLNARGMKIVAKLFVSTLTQWLTKSSEKNEIIDKAKTKTKEVLDEGEEEARVR